jgi:hypothetical protein
LTGLLTLFFESADPWIRQSGYSLGAFRASIGSLLMCERLTPAESPRQRNGQWVNAAQISGSKRSRNDSILQ